MENSQYSTAPKALLDDDLDRATAGGQFIDHTPAEFLAPGRTEVKGQPSVPMRYFGQFLDHTVTF